MEKICVNRQCRLLQTTLVELTILSQMTPTLLSGSPHANSLSQTTVRPLFQAIVLREKICVNKQYRLFQTTLAPSIFVSDDSTHQEYVN